MTDSQDGFLEKIRKQLSEQRATLTLRIGELLKQDPFADPDRVNDNAASDQDASEEANHERVTAIITELKNDIIAIDEAVARMDAGTYGICVNCAKPIEPERLAVMPTATLCATCERGRG